VTLVSENDALLVRIERRWTAAAIEAIFEAPLAWPLGAAVLAEAA
jgi:hypothetical protein